MRELEVKPIVFVDIGGYLFPDNPKLMDLPVDGNVLATRKQGKLWGALNLYIAANTGVRRNFYKDLDLLKKYRIFYRLGITKVPDPIKDEKASTDTYLIERDHFVDCESPEDKGPKLEKKILESVRYNFRVIPVVCDNRLRVAKSCPSGTNCIIFQEKDQEEEGIAEWLKNPHVKLFRVSEPWQVSDATIFIHLDFLKREILALADGERKEKLKGLYYEELKRVQRIFDKPRKYLQEDLQCI